MKERRKKHAINKVVKENPHLGYDIAPAGVFKVVMSGSSSSRDESPRMLVQ
jgi:hypothetical protein